MPPLTFEQMTCFAWWISIGLAERAGVRGRRQKNLMVGPWCAWGPTRKLRGSDFTFRVCLLIEGFHEAGLSVELAAEMVAELYFVEHHFRHTRTNTKWGNLSDFGSTLRTGYYYPSLKKWPLIASNLQAWWAIYEESRKWVISINQEWIDSIACQFQEQGHPGAAEEFRSWVDAVRNPEKKTPPDAAEMVRRFEASEQLLKTRLQQARDFRNPAKSGTEAKGAAESKVYLQATATVKLAGFYHDHDRWDQAAEQYQRALELYASPLLSDQLRGLVLPWIAAQVANCEVKQKSDAAPQYKVVDPVGSRKRLKARGRLTNR